MGMQVTAPVRKGIEFVKRRPILSPGRAISYKLKDFHSKDDARLTHIPSEHVRRQFNGTLIEEIEEGVATHFRAVQDQCEVGDAGTNPDREREIFWSQSP